MGYLAQRKKHLRTDFILKSLLVLLAFFSAAAFAGNTFGQFLNQWRFQFYLLSLLVMFYALFNRFFLYSFLALLLLLLNFFVVSSPKAPQDLSRLNKTNVHSLSLERR